MYPSSIRNLIECLKDLPGIGEKSAERLAFSILNFDPEKLDCFSEAISSVKNIKKCPICNNITDMDICYICADNSRDDDKIFVVEKAKDIVLFEKMGNYKGKYHVLGGLISPLDGINPEDINIESLIERVKNNNISEVIVVLKPSIEGETTSLYIKKVLDGLNIKVTRLASGVPIGADIEYVDSLTLERALNDRKIIE